MYSSTRMQSIVEGLVAEIRHKDAEIADLRQRKFARFNNEDCWMYQGDGDDNLESLVCPVVISAYDLLQLINNANKQIQPIRDRFTV